MLNHITIMGRMTRDPELRYTSAQTPICSFSLACERDRKGQNGEKETDFIDCTAWRHTAEFVNQYMSKGQLIVVSGRLQIRSWVTDDGKRRSAPEIVVDNAYFAESKRRSDPDERPPMPGDDDAPPEINNAPPSDLDALMQTFPGAVQFADDLGDEKLPWE